LRAKERIATSVVFIAVNDNRTRMFSGCLFSATTPWLPITTRCATGVVAVARLDIRVESPSLQAACELAGGVFGSCRIQ
jgi:hypothetical protein